jgi:hypothetical protein
MVDPSLADQVARLRADVDGLIAANMVCAPDLRDELKNLVEGAAKAPFTTPKSTPRPGQ